MTNETKAGEPGMDPWQAAIDDALVCHALDCTGPDTDPVEAVSRLLRMAVDMALDPAISERAQALIERGRSGVPAVDPPLTVKIERGRVWIERGVQSFMLDYEGEGEELEWYADRLRSALAGGVPPPPECETEGEKRAFAYGAGAVFDMQTGQDRPLPGHPRPAGVAREPLPAETAQPMFASHVGRRKWESLQGDGYRMQRIQFARSINGDERRGSIDPWGKVLWEPDDVGGAAE